MKIVLLLLLQVFCLSVFAQSKGDFVILNDGTRIDYKEYTIKNGNTKRYYHQEQVIYYDDMRFVYESGELRAYRNGFSLELETDGKIKVFRNQDDAIPLLPTTYFYSIDYQELKSLTHENLSPDIDLISKNFNSTTPAKVREMLDKSSSRAKYRKLFFVISALAFGISVILYLFGTVKLTYAIVPVVLSALLCVVTLSLLDDQDYLIETISLFNEHFTSIKS